MNKLFTAIPYIVGKKLKEQIKNNKEKTINNTSINDQKQQGIISSQEARNKIPENTRNSVDEFFNAYKLNGPEKKKENNNINLNRNSFNTNSNNSIINNTNSSNKIVRNIFEKASQFQENENTGLNNNQLNNLEGSTNEVNNLNYNNNNSENDNTRIKAIRFPKIQKIKTEELKNNLQQTNPQRNIKSGTNLTNTNTTNNNQALTPKYFNTGEKYIPTKGEQEAGDWLVMNGLFGDREEQERLRKEYREKENNNNNNNNNDNEKNNQQEQTYKRFTKEEKNPNYESYKETEKYYKDIGLNYNFKINTNSEYYDKNKAIVKQENIINILGNKDLLHEVELYPNGEEFKKDKNGKYIIDKDGKKVRNESIKMYQVREEGDTGGIYSAIDYKREYRGQCTYFVSKVLENTYPNAKLNGKSAFGLTRGVKTLIDNAERIVDSKGNQLFEKSRIPSIGSIYLNQNEDKTGGNGHVAIVTNVKLLKKGEIEEENEYEITLLEQNSTITKNGVQYEPLSNFGGGEYGEKKDNSLDYTMVVGEKTMKVIGKSGITFIKKK